MKERSPTLRFILDNLGWMLGSLALAVVVWYAASSAQNPVEQRRMTDRLPIQVLMDDGLLVVNTPATSAQVTVRAPQSVWDVLEAEDVSVVADLNKRPPGTYTIPLTATLSNARHGTVTDIQPSQITVELARRSEQLVNITVMQLAAPPPGFTASTTISDATAKIVGPEDSVKQVAAVQASVDVQDQRVSFSRVVTLSAMDANNKPILGLQITPAEVTVSVDVQPRPDVTELSVVPKLMGDLPAGYFRRNYSWDPKTVVVRGDRTIVDAMNGIVSTDPIDLTGKTASFTQKVNLSLPTGVTLPDTVEINVSIEIAPVIGSRQFDSIPVQTQGLDPADYTITVQPERVSVIVSGPQSVLDALDASEISVIAPLGGLSAGKASVTLQASVTVPGINAQDIVIPNAKADVTIVALHPTVTPTLGPTRITTDSDTPTPAPTTGS
jgi:YbbR domain-containing protein